MQHARNVGPILFVHNENIVLWRHACIAQRMHTGKPATLIVRGMPGITYGRAICAG